MSKKHNTSKYAVLIPRVKTADGESLLLEVRSGKVKQPGEICFPGGRVELGETITEAAVRETCEELGITPDKIEVISELDPVDTTDGLTIYTVAGLLYIEGTDELALSEDEVREVFLLPLAWLADRAPVHFDLKTTADEDMPDKLLDYLSYYGDYRYTGETDCFEYDGYCIWGLTARIIMMLQRHLSI